MLVVIILVEIGKQEEKLPIIKQKDIAEALKISRITVSKALSDYDDISAETKERVKKKARLYPAFPCKYVPF